MPLTYFEATRFHCGTEGLEKIGVIKMTAVFVRHHVADYQAWRKAYDGSRDMVRKMGGREATVYQEVGDPNAITVVSNFDSLKSAQSFAGSDELKAAMKAAGVQGAPTVWFAERK